MDGFAMLLGTINKLPAKPITVLSINISNILALYPLIINHGKCITSTISFAVRKTEILGISFVVSAKRSRYLSSCNLLTIKANIELSAG